MRTEHSSQDAARGTALQRRAEALQQRNTRYGMLVAALLATACVDDLPLGAWRAAADSMPPAPRSDASLDAALTDAADTALTDAADTALTDAALDALGDACTPTRCGNRVLACGDCRDNDQDGLTDALDPECWGVCSDSEATLAGTERPCGMQECFFDLNCGSGNDAQCLELTPAGCDCHGCCQVNPSGNEPSGVFVGSADANGELTCTRALVSDPSACAPCQLDLGCFAECSSCGACFSGPAPACDASCTGPGCGGLADAGQ